MFMNPLLDIRIVLFLIVMAVIGYGLWDYHEKEVTIQNLQKTVAVDNVAVKADTLSITETAKSTTIDNSVSTALASATTAADTKISNVQQATTTKVATIKTQYKAQPATPANAAAEAAEIDAAQIDGLWSTYCTGTSTDTTCPNTQPPPAVVTPQPQSNAVKLPAITLPVIEPLKLPSIDTTDMKLEAIEKIF